MFLSFAEGKKGVVGSLCSFLVFAGSNPNPFSFLMAYQKIFFASPLYFSFFYLWHFVHNLGLKNDGGMWLAGCDKAEGLICNCQNGKGLRVPDEDCGETGEGKGVRWGRRLADVVPEVAVSFISCLSSLSLHGTVLRVARVQGQHTAIRRSGLSAFPCSHH